MCEYESTLSHSCCLSDSLRPGPTHSRGLHHPAGDDAHADPDSRHGDDSGANAHADTHIHAFSRSGTRAERRRTDDHAG